MLKTLQVSTSLVRDWDEGQLVLEGGMVPDYVNLFPPMFYKGFHVCIYGIITCLLPMFFKYSFWACKYLNAIGLKSL